MPRTTIIHTTFSRGELSPYLDGRIDIEAYFNGAKTVENFFILPYGGLMRRPGTYYVAEVKDSSKATRLISFQFSTTQSYIIEIGHQYMRFYKDRGQIIDGGDPYEIATSYDESDIFDLQFVQDKDTMWIVHPSYKPQKLTRTGHTSWTLSNYTPTADPFTGSDDYPSCVTIFEQRLIFANSNNDPQKIWTTKSGDYDDMTTGSNDDDAMTYILGSQQVHAIRWLASGKLILIGTLGGVFSLSSGNNQDPLTPTNVTVKLESAYGAIGKMPKKIGNLLYYLQRNAKILREIGYSYEIDEYQANEASILSEHITGDGIVDMDYQQAPFNMLWLVRSDGEIATMTVQLEQKVKGWARQITEGDFESVAVIPGDSSDDEVWFIVKRYIDGSYVRYVEYLKPITFDEQEDAYFVDCGLTLDNPITISGATTANPVVITATSHGLSDGDTITIRNIIGMTELNGGVYKVANKTDDTFELQDTDGNDIDGTGYTTYISDGEARKRVISISGLDHLEGESVSILGDGAVNPEETVSSGEITIDNASGEVHAGLQYISTLQTMRIEIGTEQGTAQSKLKKLSKVVIRLFESVGCKIGDENSQDTVMFRSTDDETDEMIPLFTGDKTIPFRGDWGKDTFVVVKQEDPLPLNILALINYITVEHG